MPKKFSPYIIVIRTSPFVKPIMAPPSVLLGPPLIHRSPCTDDENPSSQSLSSAQKPKPSRNPCMDLFFSHHFLQNLPLQLEISWIHDPLTTLQIIFNFRNCNKEAFLPAILWLHQCHPITLACNISTLASTGRLNDLLKILCTILDSPKDSGVLDIKNSEKKQRDIARARKALEKYVVDAKYRFLHNQISNIFADLLRADLQFFASWEIDKISRASVCCPSLDSICDKSTLICESIARKLFPREIDAEYEEIDEAHYAYRVRNRLRKQVLVPLRTVLNATNHVSSLRRKRTQEKTAHEKLFAAYRKAYQRHCSAGGNDDDRLQMFLDMIPKTRMQNLPRDIVASLNDGSVGTEVSELQWQSLVECYAKKQCWKNCLAIYNMSEDARGAAADFALGMGLLISELGDEPWNGKMLTFSKSPIFCKVEGSDLGSKIQFMRKLKHGENISIPKVFDQVLEAAVAGNVSVDMMVSKILVFTDVEFEKATNNFWAVWASLFKYQSQGYKKLPEIVFWDVRESIRPPKAKKLNGLVIVKGFCDSWVKFWLEKGEFPKLEEMFKIVTTPKEFMKLALRSDELQNLIVFD